MEMRTNAIFERKVGLSPKELNKVGRLTIDDLLIEKIRADIEGKCSQHGWVIPGTTRIISRSMCQNESGRFTGTMVSWVQIESAVYYPTDRMEIIGEVLKKNKMGMFVTYENAIQIMVPRDLHLGEMYDAYEEVKIGDYVRVELKKSRFQANDPYILSVGLFKEVVEKPVEAAAAAAPAFKEVVAPPAAATAAVPAPASAAPAADAPVLTDDEVEGPAGAAAAAVEEFEEEEEEEIADGGESKLNEQGRRIKPPMLTQAAAPSENPARGATIGSFL